MASEIGRIESAQRVSRRTALRRAVGASALALAFMAGCAPTSSSTQAPAKGRAKPGADTEGSIRVMVWSGLVEQIVKENAVKSFNQKYPKVKVELEIGTNADLYPKLVATRSNPQFDGAMMNDLFSAVGNQDDMWQKFDPELVPNAASIPADLNPPGGFGYALMLTQFGLAYNPEKVPNPPQSWADLYKPEYKGRIAMSDGYFASYQLAALLEGDKTMDVEKGIQVWQKYKDNIGTWSNAEGQKAELVSRGEMWLAPKFGAWTEQEKVQGKNELFTIPKEGAIQWLGALQVIKGVSPQNAELAQLFFNEWYSKEFQQALVKQGFYIPARADVDIPAELKGTSPAIMTADEAKQKLLRYDVEAVAKKQREYTALIQRTLKA